MRLNLGCGRDYREGWVNVDHPKSMVPKDRSWDFDSSEVPPWAVDATTPRLEGKVDHSEGVHVLEHLRDPLRFMQTLWVITKPGGTARFFLPHGGSDDAWTDPTHRRPYFANSFDFFAQPSYFRADYGYRGDWQPKIVMFHMDAHFAAMEDRQLLMLVNHQRNVVREMEVVLECIKPARRPDKDLREPARLQFVFPAEQ